MVNLHMSDDAPQTRLETSEDGGFIATVPKIHKVGVSNLCAIERHTVTRIVNSTSHFIRFIGGGDLRKV
jgi:hypothetical protein